MTRLAQLTCARAELQIVHPQIVLALTLTGDPTAARILGEVEASLSHYDEAIRDARRAAVVYDQRDHQIALAKAATPKKAGPPECHTVRRGR